MSNVSSVEAQYQSLMERTLISVLTGVPCLVFLSVNGTMMWTLRSKALFRDTARYLLLVNLILADTIQMSLSQLLYFIAVSRVRLPFPVCGLLTMLGDLTNEISPITLVVMSLERYVAVCFPLRHSGIATNRNTAVAIVCIWAFGFGNTLVRLGLLLQFPFKDLDSLIMKDFCSSLAMRIGPLSEEYDRGYTCFLFIFATMAITSSYVAVIVAAKAASGDKSQTQKARNTVLLHLVQLVLSLSSTVYSPLLLEVAKSKPRIVFVRLQSALYVTIFLFPRCLSSLIYGIRDQSIRRVLVHQLLCRKHR